MNRRQRLKSGQRAVHALEPLELRLFLHAGHAVEAPGELVGAASAVLRINVGGKQFTDPAGLVWAADSGFNGGKAVRSKFAVVNTESDPLFSNRRQGQFNYTLAVADGPYTLSLGFVDTLKKPGKRLFNIDGEGQRLVSDLDIVSSAGSRAALALSYTVDVTGGALELSFTGVKGKPVLSAISLAPFVAEAPPPIPPAAPSALAASASSATSVALIWADNSNDETGFELERSADAGATFVPLLTLPANTTTYTDTAASGLEPSHSYQYHIRSVSESGASAWSNVSAVTTPAVPQAPSALAAKVPTSTAIALSWTDNSTDETGFIVERAGANRVFSSLATLPANSSNYRDETAAAGTSYIYRIRATSAAGPSANSNEVSATTPAVDTFTKVSWKERAPSPIVRAEALGGVLDGKLYLFGGFNVSNGPVMRSDVYDPATNSWTRISDLPTRVTHAGTVVDGRNFYFAGGYVGIGPGFAQQFATKDVWQYNVDSNFFTRLPDLPQARGAGGMVLLGRKLHFFGGGDLARTDRAEHFVLDLDDLDDGWSNAAPLPSPRTHIGYVAFEGKAYAVAGQTGLDATLVPLDEVAVWDPASPDAWQTVAPTPRPISHIGAATFVAGGRIVILGGERGEGNWLDEASAYDPVANKWVDLTFLPGNRFSGVGGLIDGKFYFSTGSNTDTTYVGLLG